MNGRCWIAKRWGNEFTNVTLCKVWHDLLFLPCGTVFSIKPSILFSLCRFRRDHRPFCRFWCIVRRFGGMIAKVPRIDFWTYYFSLNGQVSNVPSMVLCACVSSRVCIHGTGKTSMILQHYHFVLSGGREAGRERESNYSKNTWLNNLGVDFVGNSGVG